MGETGIHMGEGGIHMGEGGIHTGAHVEGEQGKAVQECSTPGEMCVCVCVCVRVRARVSSPNLHLHPKTTPEPLAEMWSSGS